MIGTLEIYKNWRTRVEEGAWSNRYEWFSPTIEAVVDDLVPAVLLAERGIHLDQVEFLRWTVGVYQANTDKLDPNIAPNGGLAGTGSRPIGAGQAVDLNTTYQTRFGSAGRARGKKAYRGVLMESDLTATATGRWQLESNSSLQPFNSGYDAWEDPLGLITGLPVDTTQLVLYTRFQTSPRGALPKVYGPWTYFVITSLDFLKVGNVKMDHRHFNRTS